MSLLRGSWQLCTLEQHRERLIALACFVLGHAHGMRKFWGQGLNPHHSNDTRSLTHCATGELLQGFWFCFAFRATPMAYGSSWARAESELLLPTYTTATATPDLSLVYDLHHSNDNTASLTPCTTRELLNVFFFFFFFF